MVSQTPDPFSASAGAEMADVSAIIAQQQLYANKPISRTKINTLNNRTDNNLSPSPKQKSLVTPSSLATEGAQKMGKLFTGTSSFPMQKRFADMKEATLQEHRTAT